MAASFIGGAWVIKAIKIFFLFITVLPAYGFAVSNLELMDKLDDIEMQLLLREQARISEQNQRQMKKFYEENFVMPYVPIPREYAIESAAFMNMSLDEYRKRELLANRTCYKTYGGLYKTESKQSTTCYDSIMLQISEQEALRRRENIDKHCPKSNEDRKCIKDYYVLGKRNILGIAW
jgi:hypothetical protein